MAQKRSAKHHKANHGHVNRKHRKRVKRTKIVHYYYKHMPKRGAVVTTIHSRTKIIKHNN